MNGQSESSSYQKQRLNDANKCVTEREGRNRRFGDVCDTFVQVCVYVNVSVQHADHFILLATGAQRTHQGISLQTQTTQSNTEQWSWMDRTVWQSVQTRWTWAGHSEAGEPPHQHHEARMKVDRSEAASSELSNAAKPQYSLKTNTQLSIKAK